MLFVEVDCQAVASGETLAAHVTFVASCKSPLVTEKQKQRILLDFAGGKAEIRSCCLIRAHLVLLLVVNLHGAGCPRREATPGNVAAERRVAAVGVQVLTQVDQILTATKGKQGKALKPRSGG